MSKSAAVRQEVTALFAALKSLAADQGANVKPKGIQPHVVPQAMAFLVLPKPMNTTALSQPHRAHACLELFLRDGRGFLARIS